LEEIAKRIGTSVDRVRNFYANHRHELNGVIGNLQFVRTKYIKETKPRNINKNINNHQVEKSDCSMDIYQNDISLPCPYVASLNWGDLNSNTPDINGIEKFSPHLFRNPLLNVKTTQNVFITKLPKNIFNTSSTLQSSGIIPVIQTSPAIETGPASGGVYDFSFFLKKNEGIVNEVINKTDEDNVNKKKDFINESGEKENDCFQMNNPNKVVINYGKRNINVNNIDNSNNDSDDEIFLCSSPSPPPFDGFITPSGSVTPVLYTVVNGKN
jgi:hypothetical protein